MSELRNVINESKNFRWQLLTTVSVLVLTAIVSGAEQTIAEEGGRPTVWIDLGGELQRIDAGAQAFAPQFILETPRPAPETISPLNVGHPPRYSVGGEAKVRFEPENSNWIFSAAIRFGRSTSQKHLHQQSYPTQPLRPPFTPYQAPRFQYALPFSDAKRKETENYVILDFQAGKDVGVGLFGSNGDSALNLGIRFAQFGTKSNVAFKSQPDFDRSYKYFYSLKLTNGIFFHSNQATAAAVRSFRGVGPSLSWQDSSPLVGSAKNERVTFDWGMNASVLFGRQKASVHHQTTARYHSGVTSARPLTTVYRHTPPDKIRSHSAIVPNVGGFAGLSFRYDAAKVSFGYRADFFFGAMDGGIDTRKTYDRNFYGPYATISIGLGE